jgi:hypothetical protein
MQISVPLTGTAISLNPIIGDPEDPIRLIALDLGNVSWQLVILDLENDLALVEITPADEGDYPTGEVDGEGKPVYKRRRLTPAEKQKLLDDIKEKLLSKPVDELYWGTKSARLKKPQVNKNNGK